MSNWLGRVTPQITGIIILSLVAAYALSTLVLVSFGIRPGPPPEIARPISEISTALKLFAAFPDEDHDRILKAIARPGLVIREGEGTPPSLLQGTCDWEAALLRAIRTEPGFSDQVIALDMAGEPNAGRFTVLARVPERPDRWILFEATVRARSRLLPMFLFPPGGLASFVAVPLLVILVSIWATRRVTSPLSRLAMAAEGLTAVGNPNSVAEEGTVEIRQVAHAFNVMAARLARGVTERTRMLAAISHDIRTPLTRLRLRSDSVEPAALRDKMLTDIAEMEAMIASSLAFIREEASQEPTEWVDIAVLLQTICDEFADAGFTVDYDGPLHAAGWCRPLAFRRAVNNLLDNSRKFATTAWLRLETSPGSTVITVEDDGAGIPDSQKEAVFTPFFRGESAPRLGSGGVGLGLAIVNAIVRSHRGYIRLGDRKPNGLKISLHLPGLVQTQPV